VAKKTRLNVVKDDDEDDEGVVENTTRGGQSEDDGDQSSSDDLFGEDEINEIAAESRHQNRQSLEEEPTEVKSRLRKGTRAQTTEVAAKKRSALDLYEEEEYNEDGEEDGESGDEGEVKVKKTSKPSSSADDVFPGGEVDTSELADLTDYQRIQTRRMFIDKWISEPFFDGVVIGSFVRLFVGLQESVQIYRMCEVTDVVPYKRPYRLPGTEITVDRALLVKLGSSEKVAKMYHVSNSRISEKEFQFYVNTMKACREEDKLLRKNVDHHLCSRLTPHNSCLL
jgi:RNA polymerase-associated protein RTF1